VKTAAISEDSDPTNGDIHTAIHITVKFVISDLVRLDLGWLD